ncbi:hypothetical protein PCE1_002792 [Barthelona sp. PCE]
MNGLQITGFSVPLQNRKHDRKRRKRFRPQTALNSTASNLLKDENIQTQKRSRRPVSAGSSINLNDTKAALDRRFSLPSPQYEQQKKCFEQKMKYHDEFESYNSYESWVEENSIRTLKDLTDMQSRNRDFTPTKYVSPLDSPVLFNERSEETTPVFTLPQDISVVTPLEVRRMTVQKVESLFEDVFQDFLRSNLDLYI